MRTRLKPGPRATIRFRLSASVSWNLPCSVSFTAPPSHGEYAESAPGITVREAGRGCQALTACSRLSAPYLLDTLYKRIANAGTYSQKQLDIPTHSTSLCPLPHWENAGAKVFVKRSTSDSCRHLIRPSNTFMSSGKGNPRAAGERSPQALDTLLTLGLFRSLPQRFGWSETGDGRLGYFNLFPVLGIYPLSRFSDIHPKGPQPIYANSVSRHSERALNGLYQSLESLSRFLLGDIRSPSHFLHHIRLFHASPHTYSMPYPTDPAWN